MMVQCRNRLSGSAQHMPRKPRPPMPNLHIEALSTGQQVGLVDEFTQEPIAAPTPAKPPREYSEWERTKSAQRLQRAQDVLCDAGLMQRHAEPKPQIELIPQGKRKVAQLGDLAVLAPIAPWRRF